MILYISIYFIKIEGEIMPTTFGKKKNRQHYVFYTVITAALLCSIFLAMVGFLYVDAKNEIAQKFERASSLAFNDLTTTGDWRFPTLTDEMTVVVLNNKLEPIDYIHFYGVSFVKFGEVAFDIAGGDGSSIEIPCTISYLYYKRQGSDTVYAGNA